MMPLCLIIGRILIILAALAGAGTLDANPGFAPLNMMVMNREVCLTKNTFARFAVSPSMK